MSQILDCQSENRCLEERHRASPGADRADKNSCACSMNGILRDFGQPWMDADIATRSVLMLRGATLPCAKLDIDMPP